MAKLRKRTQKLDQQYLNRIARDICEHAFVNHATSPTSLSSIDPGTVMLLHNQALAFLANTLPVLLEHGWTPPTTTHPKD